MAEDLQEPSCTTEHVTIKVNLFEGTNPNEFDRCFAHGQSDE